MTDLNRKSIFNLNELSAFTGIPKSTLYKYSAKNQLPGYKRNKFLYFDRKEIIKWLKENPINTKKQSGDSEESSGSIEITD
jgi:predicted DNA-binding transcriptional regulator AlpA